MTEDQIRTAIAALPQAHRELQTAQAHADTVAKRGTALALAVTAEVPHGLPIHFRLAGDEAAAVLALLPRIADAAVAAKTGALRDLVDRIHVALS